MFIRAMPPWNVLINVDSVDYFEMSTNTKLGGRTTHVIIAHFRHFVKPVPEPKTANDTIARTSSIVVYSSPDMPKTQDAWESLQQKLDSVELS